MMNLFLVNKSITLTDILAATGIRRSNFWFEYLMKFFINAQLIENFESLVNFLQGGTDQATVIRELNKYDIDGNFFEDNKVFVFDPDEFGNDVDLTKIKSRRIKVKKWQI